MAANEKSPAGRQESDSGRRGWLYHDPEDPRVLVPKPLPWFGWTLNTAHPVGRLLAALAAALLVGLVVMALARVV